MWDNDQIIFTNILSLSLDVFSCRLPQDDKKRESPAKE